MGAPTVRSVLADSHFARLGRLGIELPTWGFADTGTRFGKFLQDAAALTLEDKLDDAAEVHRLTGACPSVALHVLWDVPNGEAAAVRSEATKRGLRIGSVNPNLFQDQRYRFGSVTHTSPAIRAGAISHLLDSVRLAAELGSNTLALWFADGTNYPGQGNVRRRKRAFEAALCEVHDAMPPSMTMLVEYKPFEPAFYFTDIADWGMAYAHARKAGPRAKVLVDTGHHYPGQNIEQIVAFLADESMLGGFHFNDRHYADDDLTTGSIDPARIFRIFVEILSAERDAGGDLPIEYMIDQSHNIKPKIEAMLQTVMTIQELFAKALLVDQDTLERRRQENDVVGAEECLKSAFATDVRGELAGWRRGRGLPENPLEAHRLGGYEARVAADRVRRKGASSASYA